MTTLRIKDWRKFQHFKRNAIAMKRKTLSPALRKKIFERDGPHCSICGEETRLYGKTYDSPFDRGPKAGSVDHIIPVSYGGSDSEENLRWTCKSCNCSRGNRHA